MPRYRERRYRHAIGHDRLVSFEVRVQETDLFILAESDLSKLAKESLYRIRGPLEGYISQHPQFLHALTPLPSDPLAPPLVREMLAAARATETGPMAAVAGAIAERLGRLLLEESKEIIVENGGDCFLKVDTPVQIGIFAGRSKLNLAVRIQPGQTPVGICTSSGTVGHSLSLGHADAVTVIAPSTALADAAATSICNQVKHRGDISRALDFGRQIEGVLGVLVIVGETMGAWGQVELVSAGG